MKTKQSKLDTNLSTKTGNPSRNIHLTLLISLFLMLILISYFIWRKAQIDAAQQLVDDCSLNNNCFQFEITSALETLIRARKNVKSFNLSGANLEGANLAKADLYRTDFTDTNLTNANFTKANLYRTNLSKANLTNANLEGANLTNANLKSAKNFTPTQIKSACNWEKAFYQGRFDSDYAELIIERQANQEFIRQLQQARDSDPKQPVDCDKWKRWTQER